MGQYLQKADKSVFNIKNLILYLLISYYITLSYMVLIVSDMEYLLKLTVQWLYST